MTDTAVRIAEVAPLDHDEAMALASAEHQRMLELLRSLEADDWSQPTDCSLWDVRAMAGHVTGMTQAFTGFRELARQMRAGKRAAGDGPMVDGLTAVQVREQAGLATSALLDRLAEVGPASVRFRSRFPRPLRRLPMKEEVDGTPETWRLGYLLDTILTRDTWMHRMDVARATGRELVLTPEHDGRLLAGVVAEWARRHGRPFTLRVSGPAGGTFVQGTGGDDIAIDAVELCRTLSGRAEGAGLLAQQVPF
jgi:uncharacterized protein (TIGR03083 family)